MTTTAAILFLLSALAEPQYQPMPSGEICFRGDGSPLSDLCVSTWEATTVVECASAGSPYVPFNVNSGGRNPGAGYVRLYEDTPDGQRLIAETAFSARGFLWPHTTVINVEPDEVGFRDGGEACACHSRAIDAAKACETVQ